MEEHKNKVCAKLMDIDENEIEEGQKAQIMKELLSDPIFIESAFKYYDNDVKFSKFVRGLLPQAPPVPTASLSPSELDQIISKLKDDELIFKEDPFVPQRLSLNRANFPRLGREKQFKLFFQALKERQDLRSIGHAPTDRKSNPLPGTQGAPGTGKSFLLDEIGSFKQEDIEKFCPDHVKSIPSNIISVLITYNSATPYDVVIDRDDCEVGLALRVLWSFYFEKGFRMFCKKMENYWSSLTLELAIQTVLHVSKKANIFLGVDELMKSSGPGNRSPDNPGLITSIVGSLLNIMPNFHTLITSLDIRPIRAEKTGSGRPIEWISLPPLSAEESLKLFDGQELNDVIKQAISDCNGHPRTLETLWKICEMNSWKMDNYHTILNQLLPYLDTSVPPFSLMKEVLKGNPVGIDSSPPNDEYTYRQYIELGMLTNSLSESEHRSFVPMLSPICLLVYAYKTVIKDEEKKIVSILKDLLRLEPNFGFPQFELFHANWEELQRLLRNGEIVDLFNLYHLDGESGIQIPMIPKEVKKLKHHFSFNTEQVKLDSTVIVPGDGNPGFDIINFEKTTNGRSIAIAVECRFSAPGTTTQLSLAEVKEKRRLTVEQFKNGPQKRNAEDIYLVVVAHRKLQSHVRQHSLDQKESKGRRQVENTIILGQDELKHTYGPTLISRPQFILTSAGQSGETHANMLKETTKRKKEQEEPGKKQPKKKKIKKEKEEEEEVEEGEEDEKSENEENKYKGSKPTQAEQKEKDRKKKDIKPTNKKMPRN